MKRHLKTPSTPTEGGNETRKKEKSEFLNTEQAATYLGVSKSFLEKRRQRIRPDLMRQSPPFHAFGRIIRYDTLDLDYWREARRFDPEGPANG